MNKKTIVTFLMGVIASLIGTIIWWSISTIPSNKVKQLSDLNGYWFEEIPNAVNRNYSIGNFYYNKKTKSYHYDGNNYQNDGKIFCTWRSANLSLDFVNKKIYYIFESSPKDKLYDVNYGFGVININIINNKIVPISGFYRETLIDAEPYSHDFKRLDDIIRSLNLNRNEENLEKMHSSIIQIYGKKRPLSDINYK